MSLGGYRLSADEIACVKKLAALYEAGEGWVKATRKDRQSPFNDEVGLPAEKREAILGVMEQTLGVILNVRHDNERRYCLFQISPTVLQVARAIEAEETREEEPGDIVEQIQNAARRKPLLAWVIIAFIVLTAIVAFVNQTLELLAKFGLAKFPH